jgi:hypothetical protein
MPRSVRAITQRHAWPHEHCANEAIRVPATCGEGRAPGGADVNLAARLQLREVGPIELTVNDLDRELAFFTNTLPFQLLSITAERLARRMICSR